MHGHGLQQPKKAGLSGLFLYAALVIALPTTADRAPLISFKMSEASQAAFAELTRNNIGRKLEICVDGKAMPAPVIREPILSGAGQIIGPFTFDQARDIAERLNAGTAKLDVEIVN